MRLKLLLTSLIAFSLLLVPQVAGAHVLIRDKSKQVGAVLHVNPDDDPIAGQQSSFFFDIQSQALANGEYNANLEVTDSTGQQTVVPVTVSGNSVSASYTFPLQGVYELRLTTQTASQTNIFSYSQRVARGTASSALDKPTYAWAAMSLIACGCLFLLLLIIAINRRKDIATQSKW